MNWKYEAVEKLRDYEAKKSALERIPEEIKRLEISASSIRSSTRDGTPVQGGGSGRENMLLSNICHRDELRRNLNEAAAWVHLVEAGLEKLTDEERLVLDRFYIHPSRGNVDRLCGDLACEQSTVYRKRDKALRHFTIALYGLTES